jgi:hypothetical protein
VKALLFPPVSPFIKGGNKKYHYTPLEKGGLGGFKPSRVNGIIFTE